jgi:hypothetical protein
MITRAILTCLLSFLLCICPVAYVQALPTLFNSDRVAAPLPEIDQLFMQSRLDALSLAGACRQERLAELPHTTFRYLETSHEDGVLRLYVQADVIRSKDVLIVQETANGLTAWNNCNQEMADQLLPVVAIMTTFRYTNDSHGNQTRQAVLASHSFLTSHEPSMLMIRNDSLDSSATYQDFQVSAKHPLFANAALVNNFHNNLTDTLQKLIPGDDEYFIQLYLSFTGRFSQYIQDRDSQPVVPRSFNPSVFYRIWSSRDNFLDLGFGHESNGQRIRSPESLQRAEADYLAEGEPAFYARDSLTRSWDYVGLGWQRNWDNHWLSSFRLRHYLNDGPLQGRPEEYNTWEDDGYRSRPRAQYDGINLALQYNFNTSRCLLGSIHICLRNVKYSHDTGYSTLFGNNTSTLELTTDFFGIPVQVWGKTGYNSNLVDYYRHTTSWGLGLELFSR